MHDTVKRWVIDFVSWLALPPPDSVADDAALQLLTRLNASGFPLWDLCDGNLLVLPRHAFGPCGDGEP